MSFRQRTIGQEMGIDMVNDEVGTEMKVFAIEHDGVYLGGFAVVVADSIEAANSMMKKLLIEMKLDPDKNYKVSAIDTNNPGVYLLWNGDY